MRQTPAKTHLPTLAAVLLSGVLLPNGATDYPEGNIHE